MSNREFTITIHDTNHNGRKLDVIKTLKKLAGSGLKEAKDMSETAGTKTYDLCLPNYASYGNSEHEIQRDLQELRNLGIDVGPSIHKILASLREVAAQALAQGDDEVANEILQLVLAEKLKHK